MSSASGSPAGRFFRFFRGAAAFGAAEVVVEGAALVVAGLQELQAAVVPFLLFLLLLIGRVGTGGLAR